MMKYLLALALLLHLCHSSKTNKDLTKEIIKNLKELNKARVTLPAMMRLPSTDMHDNATLCVGVFIRELRTVLNNLRAILNNSVAPQNIILTKLDANLDAMGQHEENDQECRMIESTTSLTPFSAYAAFLRTLNQTKGQR